MDAIVPERGRRSHSVHIVASLRHRMVLPTPRARGEGEQVTGTPGAPRSHGRCRDLPLAPPTDGPPASAGSPGAGARELPSRRPQIATELLLCARLCSGCWGHSRVRGEVPALTEATVRVCPGSESDDKQVTSGPRDSGHVYGALVPGLRCVHVCVCTWGDHSHREGGEHSNERTHRTHRAARL